MRLKPLALKGNPFLVLAAFKHEIQPGSLVLLAPSPDGGLAIELLAKVNRTEGIEVDEASTTGQHIPGVSVLIELPGPTRQYVAVIDRSLNDAQRATVLGKDVLDAIYTNGYVADTQYREAYMPGSASDNEVVVMIDADGKITEIDIGYGSDPRAITASLIMNVNAPESSQVVFADDTGQQLLGVPANLIGQQKPEVVYTADDRTIRLGHAKPDGTTDVYLADGTVDQVKLDAAGKVQKVEPKAQKPELAIDDPADTVTARPWEYLASGVIDTEGAPIQLAVRSIDVDGTPTGRGYQYRAIAPAIAAEAAPE